MQAQTPLTGPTLCRTGCGFYAHSAFDGMCSKCYKDHAANTLNSSASSTSTTSPPLLAKGDTYACCYHFLCQETVKLLYLFAAVVIAQNKVSSVVLAAVQTNMSLVSQQKSAESLQMLKLYVTVIFCNMPHKLSLRLEWKPGFRICWVYDATSPRCPPATTPMT